MSDELEMLRADLKRIESLRLRYRADVFLGDVSDDLREKIARLEAEADPWRRSKHAVEYFRGFADHKQAEHDVVAYVDHLTAENASLTKRVAELEQNSVWGIHSQVDGHLIKAFLTREEAEEELEKDTSKPRFKEVRVSDANKIVKALNTSQKYESMFRVERDKAWKLVAELEKEDAADVVDVEAALAKGEFVPFEDTQPPSETAWVESEIAKLVEADSDEPGPLDPARVLATARTHMNNSMNDIHGSIAYMMWCHVKESQYAEPYRLKGAGE